MNRAFQEAALRRGFTGPGGERTHPGHDILLKAVVATALVFCAVAAGTAAYYGGQEARADSRQHTLQSDQERALDGLRDVQIQIRNETGALMNAQANLRGLEEENAAAAEQLAQLRAQIEHLRGEKAALETSR